MFSQKQLQVFRAVMSTGSVSQAADRMNLSQPSVSRILGDLERQFGAALFLRKSKGVRPTPEAVAFLEEVERHYLVLRNLTEAAAQISRKERGKLTFATMTAASLEIVPRALERMQAHKKHLTINWHVKSSNWVIDFTRSGTINTGLASITNLPGGMRILYECSVPHMCLFQTDHLLAQQSGVLELRDLRPYHVIGLLGQVADELAIRQIGKNASSPMSAETSLAAIGLSRHCSGIPIVDAFTAHDWVAQNEGQARPIVDLPAYRIAMFEPSGTQPAMVDRDFQDCLVKEIEFIRTWVDTHLAIQY